MLDFKNINILTSVIESASTILSTVIAAITAALIGKKFSNQDKLKDDLRDAMNDITFLLKVEEEHCTYNKENIGASNKNKVRTISRNSTGLSFTGRFTLSKIQERLRELGGSK